MLSSWCPWLLVISWASLDGSPPALTHNCAKTSPLSSAGRPSRLSPALSTNRFVYFPELGDQREKFCPPLVPKLQKCDPRRHPSFLSPPGWGGFSIRGLHPTSRMHTSVASLFLMFLFQNLRFFLYTGAFLPLADISSICKREGAKKNLPGPHGYRSLVHSLAFLHGVLHSALTPPPVLTHSLPSTHRLHPCQIGRGFSVYLNPSGAFKPPFFLAALNAGPILQYLEFLWPPLMVLFSQPYFLI